MLTSSFKTGFARGFAAPLEFFAPRKITRPPQFDASVERAWQDVGKALSDATSKVGATVEQKTKPHNKGHSKAT